MRIEIDLGSVPPAVTLLDPDEFTRFEIAVSRPEHAFVSVDELRRLAGARAADPAWAQQLEAMLAYAQGKGWCREDGAVRAHIEWA